MTTLQFTLPFTGMTTYIGLMITGDDRLNLGPFTHKCPHSGIEVKISSTPLVDTPCPCGNKNCWIVKYKSKVSP